MSITDELLTEKRHINVSLNIIVKNQKKIIDILKNENLNNDDLKIIEDLEKSNEMHHKKINFHKQIGENK